MMMPFDCTACADDHEKALPDVQHYKSQKMHRNSSVYKARES